jgi:hypothetical protein
MRAARMLRTWPLALAALLLLYGCQRPVTLHAVSGKVTYKGAVLHNGIIVFTPDASRGESGPIALGTIREDGTYLLATGEALGASPGWYRVTIAAFSAAPPKSAAPVPLLPEKYRDPELSLLRCQVKSDRANTIDFNLD